LCFYWRKVDTRKEKKRKEKKRNEKKRKLKWNRMVPFCLIPSGLCYFFPLWNLKINPIKLNLLFFF
jgi:hypothetical protein